MKTIVLESPEKLFLKDTPAPNAPGPGEALVGTRRIGVCGTDYHAYHGRQPFFSYPRILGHELGVEVLAVGLGVTGVSPGDRCAVEPYLNCGRCIACRRGKTNCCVELRVLGVHIDGGMRERIVVPAAKLHRSERLSFDQLALVETLGIGAHAVARARPERGEHVLVIGAGPIGMSVLQFAVEAGARVIALDTNATRLEFCRTHLGVERTVVVSEMAADEIRALTDGDMPTAVFDATGSVGSMEQAFGYVAAGGRLTFVGLVQADVRFHDPEFHRRELTLFATRNSTGDDFRQIVALMDAGRIDTTPWITHRARLAELPERFTEWLDPAAGVVKAIIEVE